MLVIVEEQYLVMYYQIFLKFNGNKVTKEYYINDYGNQIKNFVKSVYLRIREIKYKEKFKMKKIFILVIILKI